MTTKSFGDRGEDLAAQYLEKRGCRILERQFRAKTGEIDIIAEDRGALLFIEVKTRRRIYEAKAYFSHGTFIYAEARHGRAILPF